MNCGAQAGGGRLPMCGAQDSGISSVHFNPCFSHTCLPILTDVESKKVGSCLTGGGRHKRKLKKQQRTGVHNFLERSPGQVCRDEVFLGLMPEQVQWPTREDFLEVVSILWKKGISRTADPSQTGQAFPCVWRNSGEKPQDAKQLLKVG